MFGLVEAALDTMEAQLLAAALIFVRVGAIAFLMPGYGESVFSIRLRLGVALSLTAIVLPAIDASALPGAVSPPRFAGLLLGEAAVGLILGLSARLMVHALQLAGTIAAQSTALAQIAGPGVAPDPMPAMGNALLIAGIALAMALDLHVKVVIAIIQSYQVVGFGAALSGADGGAWGLDHATAAFRLGFTLAAPFVIAALLYNLALGAINRAMPQLMVAFIGAPAITAATLFLFLLSAPVMLSVWVRVLDRVLAAPLGPAP